MKISIHHSLRSWSQPAALALFWSLALLPVSASSVYNLTQGVNGYSGNTDTYIDSANPTKNYGTSDILSTKYASNSSGSAGYALSRETRDILIKFDVSSLSGMTAESVTLTLTVSSAVAGGGDASCVLFAYALDKSWTEGTGGSAGSTGQANWTNATTDTTWGVAGAQDATDRNLTPVATSSVFTISALAAGNSLTLTLPTALVQAWIDDPSSNDGLLLSVATTNQYRYPTLSFYSSEYATASLRPTLSVTVVPEPSTWALLMGGTGVLWACSRTSRKCRANQLPVRR